MSKSSKLSQWFRRMRYSRLFIALLYLFLGAVLFFTLIGNVRPDKLDIKLLSIAKNSIHSPVTIEDKVTTEKRKREAAQKVPDQYTYHSEYKSNRVNVVESVFSAVKEVQEETKAAQADQTDPTEQPDVSEQEQLQKLKKKLPAELVKSLSDQVLLALLNAPPDQLSVARESTITAVNYAMSDQIDMNEADRSRERIAKELQDVSVSGGLKTAIVALGQYAVVPNYFYDPVATKERRKLEMDAVDPVFILQGQILVKEGDTITREVYEQLELVGLLADHRAFQPFIGLFLLLSVLLYFIYKQFDQFSKQQRSNKPYLFAYTIIITITILTMKMISIFQSIEYNGLGYLVPVAMGTMLVKLMIGDRFVFITSLIFSISGSIMFNEGITSSLNYHVGFYLLISSLSVTVFLREKKRRSMILHAGTLVAVLNVIVLIALLLLRNGSLSLSETALHLLLAAVSGIVSSVLTLGILPYLESGLGIVSAMKLMELSSPNSPLLRKILLEAPGTYHHSIMVANLAEAACDAIGADGLLARVGAYYHDIGKTMQPHLFIENQMGMGNPHDSLKPEVSRDIIFAHVSDGVAVLEEHRIPKEIIDITAQHHGTTLLKYFYYKAVKEDEQRYTEDMFRYPGPKASSKESAVVGIADSVEAAVRSMNAPTPEQIAQLVQGIIADRLKDGQFSECNLTFKELQTIEKTICETLNGIFHSRIKYPNL